MAPNRQQDATAESPGPSPARAAAGRILLLPWRWLAVASVVLTYALSWLANATTALAGEQPTIPGAVASAAFLGSWIWYGIASAGPGWPGPKLASIYWGVAIVGLVIPGPFLRLQGLADSSASGWGVLLTVVFLLVAVPIHGIAGLWLVDRQWLVLAAVAATSYLVIVASAALTRRRLRADAGP